MVVFKQVYSTLNMLLAAYQSVVWCCNRVGRPDADCLAAWQCCEETSATCSCNWHGIT